ncbi:MAG: carbamate kinase [Pseudomonadota bacterium]|nr:carbamate kinase [Pseudomonadota bacterium]
MKSKGTAVVAVGGNSLIVDDELNAIPDQYRAAVSTSRHIVDLIELGWRVIVTHGNGPQVGFILRRSELSIKEVSPVPMDYAVADTQGAIGYMFECALRNEFIKRKMEKCPISVVTQVLVGSDDPELGKPSKPIGSSLDEHFAKKYADKEGWTIREEPGHGWRRVVPSPRPVEVLEIEAIRDLVEAGYVVVAGGGGGIPVTRGGNSLLSGIEAVIDKDHVSGLIASEVGAKLLIILTSVEKVAIGFGTEDEQSISRLSLSDAQKYLKDGEFPEGSMGPKVEAIVDFLKQGGSAGLITNPSSLGAAMGGKAGTWINIDGWAPEFPDE